MITGAQIRAARALIRWSAQRLATEARLGVATVRRAEATDGAPPITEANAAAIERVLEQCGVSFVPENGGGAGVRLKFNRAEVRAIDVMENEGGVVGEDDV